MHLRASTITHVQGTTWIIDYFFHCKKTIVMKFKLVELEEVLKTFQFLSYERKSSFYIIITRFTGLIHETQEFLFKL